MQRPYFRHPSPGPGGFRSPSPAMERGGGGGMRPSPPWAYQNPPPPFWPRYGAYGGSPNTPPRDFSAGRVGSNGKYSGGMSPGHTPRRPNNNGGGGGGGGRGVGGGGRGVGGGGRGVGGGGRGVGGGGGCGGGCGGGGGGGGCVRGGTPHRHTSYHRSPRQHGGAYQGSQQTSTPFGRERGGNDMDKYYKPSMLQDPWADLQPISVTDIKSKFSTQQATQAGKESTTA